MGKHELVIIVITAVVTAVVKESIGWLAREAIQRIKALNAVLSSAIKAFMVKYWRLVFDFLVMGFLVYAARRWVKDFPVINHGTIFTGGYLAAWVVYWNLEIIKDFSALARKSDRPPN